MNLWGPAILRFSCAKPTSFQKCTTLNNVFSVELAYLSARSCCRPLIHLYRKQPYHVTASAPHTARPRVAFMPLRTRRSYATPRIPRIITRFEDLPPRYKDQDGLPFRETPFSAQEATALFGRGIDAQTANRVLRVVHGRRVAGTLDDPSLVAVNVGYDDRLIRIALRWLRSNVPVDEDDAAGKRAELELQAMGEEVVAESERLGLYRPNSTPIAEGQSIYGESMLDKIREANKRKFEEQQRQEEEARKRQAGEVQYNSGTLAKRKTFKELRLELKSQPHPLRQYYLDRAKTIPEIPPELSTFKRLGPSALLTILVVAGSIVLSQVYQPPTSAERLWPDMPQSAATVIGLILANTAVFVAWHLPPFYRVLNMYFLTVTLYPRAVSMVGAVFSHQIYSHFIGNMILLWLMGPRLHEDIGRGNFLALYLSTGVIAGFGSLAYYSMRKLLTISSLGASGALYGVIGAYLWIHRNESFKILWFPPDPLPGFQGGLILAVLFGLEVTSMISLTKGGTTKIFKYLGTGVDYHNHVFGTLAGIAGGELLQRGYLERKKIALERRNSALRRQRLAPGDRE